MTELTDLPEFVAVVRAGGFRDAARVTGKSASGLSEAVRRLETRLGVRLVNRTTRSVAPTEAGRRLIERLGPALASVEDALDVVTGFRDRPAGRLKLNVPVAVSRLVLPKIVPGFLAAYPDVRLEVVVEDSFVDVLAEDCDAGIRYDERLELDMIAVPIGPREQKMATAASPAYLDRAGRPDHPRDLLTHSCLLGRFRGGALTTPWEFEKDGDIVKVETGGALIASTNGGMDLAIEAAIQGAGVIALFEEWLRPALDAGRLDPVLEDWWQSFSGPFLYYPGRKQLPAPLRAFVDFAKAARW